MTSCILLCCFHLSTYPNRDPLLHVFEPHDFLLSGLSKWRTMMAHSCKTLGFLRVFFHEDTALPSHTISDIILSLMQIHTCEFGILSLGINTATRRCTLLSINLKETSLHALQHLSYPRFGIAPKRMAPMRWLRSLSHWSHLDTAKVLL